MIEASVIAPTMLSNFLPTTVVRTGLLIWLLTLGQSPLTSVALGSSVSKAAQFRTRTTLGATAACPAFDLTHVLRASATAPLPFGKGRRFANSGGLFNYIIGNWQLNGILTLTSGVPYNVYISSDIPNVGNFDPGSGNVRANVVGDPNLGNPSTRNGLTPPLLPRQRLLRLAILVGIHFERTGWRIWTYHCSGIFPSAKQEAFSSGPRRSTLQIRPHGEFRSTI